MAYNPNLYMSNYNEPYQRLPFQPQPPINGLISVTGLEGAKAYQLPPNSSVALFDSDSDIMYVKTTDGAGFPTIKTYRFELMDNTQPQEQYVSRAEFDQLVQRIEAMTEGGKNGEQPVPEKK